MNSVVAVDVVVVDKFDGGVVDEFDGSVVDEVVGVVDDEVDPHDSVLVLVLVPSVVVDGVVVEVVVDHVVLQGSGVVRVAVDINCSNNLCFICVILSKYFSVCVFNLLNVSNDGIVPNPPGILSKDPDIV